MNVAQIRLAIYVVTGVGAAVVAYLATKGIIGDAEVGLWAALVAVVNGMAALNTDTSKPTGGAHSEPPEH